MSCHREREELAREIEILAAEAAALEAYVCEDCASNHGLRRALRGLSADAVRLAERMRATVPAKGWAA